MMVQQNRKAIVLTLFLYNSRFLFGLLVIFSSLTHSHTNTYIYIYIYIYKPPASGHWDYWFLEHFRKILPNFYTICTLKGTSQNLSIREKGKKNTEWLTDWLILTACQIVRGNFVLIARPLRILDIHIYFYKDLGTVEYLFIVISLSFLSRSGCNPLCTH